MSISRVPCDKKIPGRLKGKVYHMMVRLALMYGVDRVMANQEPRLEVNGSRYAMIRWMCDFTRLDKIRNEVIKEKAGVAPIDLSERD